MKCIHLGENTIQKTDFIRNRKSESTLKPLNLVSNKISMQLKKATCPDGFIIVLLKHPGTHIPYITLQIIKMGNNAITYFMSLVQFISKPNQDNMRQEDRRGISPMGIMQKLQFQQRKLAK